MTSPISSFTRIIDGDIVLVSRGLEQKLSLQPRNDSFNWQYLLSAAAVRQDCDSIASPAGRVLSLQAKQKSTGRIMQEGGVGEDVA